MDPALETKAACPTKNPGSPECSGNRAAARPLGDLLRELARESGTLAQQELNLAKAEIRDDVRRLIRDTIFVVVGALLGLAGVLALIFALVSGLTVLVAQWVGPEIAVWLTPLVVGLLIVGGGAWLIWYGIDRLRHDDLWPERAAETMEENQKWIQAKLTT